jgi:hypothetical protein
VNSQFKSSRRGRYHVCEDNIFTRKGKRIRSTVLSLITASDVPGEQRANHVCLFMMSSGTARHTFHLLWSSQMAAVGWTRLRLPAPCLAQTA